MASGYQKAKLLFSAGGSNADVVKALGLKKSTCRQYRSRYNQEAKDLALNNESQTVSMHMLSSNLTEATNAYGYASEVLDNNEMMALKAIAKQSMIKAYSAINDEAARRAKNGTLDDQTLAVMYSQQLSLFK